MASPSSNKGQGAAFDPTNPYHARTYHPDEAAAQRVEYLPVYPKTILNKACSPALGFDYSLNPYQGCEHGCIYCYARPSHNYWDEGAGPAFERRIFYKPQAPELLAAAFRAPSFRPGKIVMSGNTDCYQPIERKLRITRALLEVFLAFRHPVSILSKNALVLRDLDILSRLNEHRLVSVTFSVTTADEKLRRVMEPRTASYQKKLKAIQQLAGEKIPVGILIGPIIPGLNDQTVGTVIQDAVDAGAQWIGYTLLRLTGPLFPIFSTWLDQHFPDRKQKVLRLLEWAREGRLDGRGTQDYIHGKGELAAHIHRIVNTWVRKAGLYTSPPPLNYAAFNRGRPSLFST